MASSALPNFGARSNLRKFSTAAVLIALLPMLASCGRSIELTQEVQLTESNTRVKLKRKETFEPRLTKLDFNQTYARSELWVVGSDLPAWKERLHPMYFGELRGGAGYVLVAVIPDVIACAARGKPASPYVVFAAAREHWHEIPMPQYLDGRNANLALIVDDFPFQNELLTKTINLSAAFGC